MLRLCRPFLLIILLTLMLPGNLFAQEAAEQQTGLVYAIPINEMIDSGLAAFVERSIAKAEKADAAAIVLKIDTLGGLVDAATDIKDALFKTRIKKIAFVNRRAISAGSLLALATDTIIMAPGATMGAATPVMMGPGATEAIPTSEKEISYVRSEFRATAERTGHNVKLAEAMVDPDIELYALTVEGHTEFLNGEELENRKKELGSKEYQVVTVSAKGKLLTLTTEEALKYKLAAFQASSVPDLLPYIGLGKATVVNVEPTWSETMVRFLTNPLVAGLLLTFGVLGIFYELKMPGFGLPGAIGVICLALFFFAHTLVGLADWIEVLLFFTGVALLAVEIFVLPGFGFVGIAGIILIVLSFYLSLVKRGVPEFSWDFFRMNEALKTIALSLVAIFVFGMLMAKFLPKTPVWARIALVHTQRVDQGYVSEPLDLKQYVGMHGVAVTILRPAGRAQIGDEVVDVVTQGEFLKKNTPIKVIQVSGNRVVVRERQSE